jgi:hypothetical protein
MHICLQFIELQWTHTRRGLSNEIKSASPISLKFYQIFSDENTQNAKNFAL